MKRATNEATVILNGQILHIFKATKAFNPWGGVIVLNGYNTKADVRGQKMRTISSDQFIKPKGRKYKLSTYLCC